MTNYASNSYLTTDLLIAIFILIVSEGKESWQGKPLKDGDTTQHIAEQFKVTRQAIDLHRKDFISRGLLPDRRATRKKNVSLSGKANGNGNGLHQPELIPQSRKRTVESISLDEHIDLLINAFSALKRLSVLETELAVYKRENERISREIEHLKNLEKKRLEQEQRWMLIQKDPDDKPPEQQNSMF